MAYQRVIGLFTLLAIASSPTLATQKQDVLPAKPVVMTGEELIATFDGKTATGAYHDGVPVRETYKVGGAITYWDPNWGDKTGQWSVVNGLFCTFYDGMSGGCFQVQRIGANCFDFMIAASSEEEALLPDRPLGYTARVSLEGAPSTCPLDLSV